MPQAKRKGKEKQKVTARNAVSGSALVSCCVLLPLMTVSSARLITPPVLWHKASPPLSVPQSLRMKRVGFCQTVGGLEFILSLPNEYLAIVDRDTLRYRQIKKKGKLNHSPCGVVMQVYFPQGM